MCVDIIILAIQLWQQTKGLEFTLQMIRALKFVKILINISKALFLNLQVLLWFVPVLIILFEFLLLFND
jgi:hypothetical protein